MLQSLNKAEIIILHYNGITALARIPLLFLAALTFVFPFQQQVYADELIARVGLRTSGLDVDAVFSKEQLESDGMVCVRFNNYWCMKSVGWDGEVGKDGRGHAIFSDPVFAARAVARQLRTWRYRDGLKTTFDIMSKYAPPNDCIGSLGKFPNCTKRANPTREYATIVARSVGKGPDDDLELFTHQRKLDLKIAVPFMQAISRFEITDRYAVAANLITRGIELEPR